MKIVLVDGIQNSHNSMTTLLVNKCLEGIKVSKPEATIQIVKLKDIPIEFCIGCKKCGIEDQQPIGKCVLKDAMENILADLLAADHIVFASPIYDFTYSALMARFMERTLPLCIYPEKSWPKPRNKTRPGKKGLVLLCSDCPTPFNWLMGMTWHPSILLRMLAKNFGCSKIKVLTAGGMRAKKTWQERFEKLAFELGKNLVA